MISRLRDIDLSLLGKYDVFNVVYDDVVMVNRVTSADGEIEQLVLYRTGHTFVLTQEYGDIRGYFGGEQRPVIYGQFQLSRFHWTHADFNEFLSLIPENWTPATVRSLASEFYNRDTMKGNW